jgi:hypothetical protein
MGCLALRSGWTGAPCIFYRKELREELFLFSRGNDEKEKGRGFVVRAIRAGRANWQASTPTLPEASAWNWKGDGCFPQG